MIQKNNSIYYGESHKAQCDICYGWYVSGKECKFCKKKEKLMIILQKREKRAEKSSIYSSLLNPSEKFRRTIIKTMSRNANSAKNASFLKSRQAKK